MVDPVAFLFVFHCNFIVYVTPWVSGTTAWAMAALGEKVPAKPPLSFQATTTPLARDTARVHFDILVADLPAAHDQVIAAGATPVGEHVSPRPAPGGEPVPWRVYRDPAGHPFCLVIR